MAIPEDWWKEWWEADFSWDGLIARRWEGWSALPDGRIVESENVAEGQDAREGWSALPDGRIVESENVAEGQDARLATLQDYWRDQAGDLVQSPVTGKRFTRLHLPLVWEDGAPTGKADWPDDALDAVVGAKLAVAGETAFDGEDRVLGADRRAQCEGAVFVGFQISRLVKPSESGVRSVALRCGRAAFTRPARFSNAVFVAFARFEYAAFAGDVVFDRARFVETASFLNAVFAGEAEFKAVSYDKRARYSYAMFARDAWFEDAAFRQTAWFDGARFAGAARFDRAAFERNLWFNAAAFAGDALFDEAAFAGNVWFDDAIFAQGIAASGRGVMLREVAPAQQSLAGPSGTSRSSSVDTTIVFDPRARRAFGAISSRQAIFLGDAYFDNRDILEPSSFLGAVFFFGAHFHGGDLHQRVILQGADFERALAPERFHAAPASVLVRLYSVERRRRELRGLPAIEEAAWQRSFEAERQDRVVMFNGARKISKNARYEEIEGCFRTLKLAMEANRNRQEEARFFKLELQTRRKRRERGVPLWERVMSDLYGATSDYGNSVLRPVLWILLVLIPAFAAAYAFLGCLPVRTPTALDLIDAFAFSCARVLPFGPWAEPDKAGPLIRALLFTEPARTGADASFDALTTLGVRLLATVESVIALVLVFLAALAVRRRFQIS